MNDIRRTILWVIFGFSMVLLWDKWQVHNGHRGMFTPAPVVAVAQGTTPAAGAGAASSVPVTSASTSASSVPGAPSAATGTGAAQIGTPSDAPAAPSARERVEVTTDVLKLIFDTEGGSLVHGELRKMTSQADPDRGFVLLDQSAERVYVAQTGLIGGSFPTHKTLMSVAPGPRELRDGEQELTVRFESPDLGGV